MKITRANVQQYAEEKGYEPIQVNGIPEGFSFKIPGLTIDGKEIGGGYIAFIPNGDWNDPFATVITGENVEKLLNYYNKRNGKRN